MFYLQRVNKTYRKPILSAEMGTFFLSLIGSGKAKSLELKLVVLRFLRAYLESNNYFPFIPMARKTDGDLESKRQ